VPYYTSIISLQDPPKEKKRWETKELGTDITFKTPVVNFSVNVKFGRK